MHYTVLTAIPLPQDIAAAVKSVSVADAASFVAKKLLLKNIEDGTTPPSCTLTQMDRWECLVNTYVADLLAPYDENAVEGSFLEFEDQTEQGHQTYTQGGIDCVQTPDGRITPCTCHKFPYRYELCDGKIYRRRYGPLHHRKLTKQSKKYHALPNYPFQKLYPSFEVFMEEQYGCRKDPQSGHYGYFFNPNGQWDWWQIGGRWPYRFLVKDECISAVTGEVSALLPEAPQPEAPKGYRWVAGARKSDIAWDVMREFLRSQCAERFLEYEKWFNTGYVPKEYAGIIKLTPDGVVSWGEYLYHRGEDMERHLYSLGLSNQHPYPISTFAYVDIDGWNDKGWGIPSFDEDACQAWYKKTADFISKQSDNTLLVSADCHI